MNTTKVLSKWWRLGGGKLNLNTIILFDAIIHTDASKLSVENTNDTTLWNKYGFKFNSATLSRNNDILKDLGLIKLKENILDRRYKDITITEKGRDLSRLMDAEGSKVLKIVRT